MERNIEDLRRRIIRYDIASFMAFGLAGSLFQTIR